MWPDDARHFRGSAAESGDYSMESPCGSRIAQPDGPLAGEQFSRLKVGGGQEDYRARASRKAATCSPLRTSRTWPASTGWFQVLPSIAGNRPSSVNWWVVALPSA